MTFFYYFVSASPSFEYVTIISVSRVKDGYSLFMLISADLTSQIHAASIGLQSHGQCAQTAKSSLVFRNF